MAAQTLTAASNYDGPTLMLGLNNGETVTVNGGALTIDGDVRWGQNAAVHGNITVSATLGGSVLFEGRNVWELPFTAASGNVPALAALGSNGVTGGTSGATGELFRVWGAGLEPLAAGGAIPASGWVKLRSKTGTFSAGEVVTLPGGATITISGPGKRSWIHVVGNETGVINIPRLGDVKWRGEWFELGTTNGADDQTFQFPVADACPAIWIEKYPGSYALLGEFGLECWLSGGWRWGTATAFIAQDVRGKYFGQNLTTGVITIAQRAVNACGFKPATGLRVFCPNLILSSSSSTSGWAANTSPSPSNRYELATSLGGSVDMQGCSAAWFLDLVSPVSVALVRTATFEMANVRNTPNRINLADFAVGLSENTTAYNPMTLTACYSGLTMTRVRMVRSVQNSTYAIWNDVGELDGSDVQFESFGAAAAAGRTLATSLITRRVKGAISGLSLVGVSLNAEGSNKLKILDLKYADATIGTTGTAAQQAAVTASVGSSEVIVDGFSNFGGLPNVQPYDTIMMTTGGAVGCGVQNVGSPSAPYDCGSANAMGSAVAADTTSGALNVLARRVYLSGNRLEAVGLANATDGVELTNVWASTGVNQVIDANNVRARGCKWSPSSAGRSAVYGVHWQDQFTDDTSGALTISANEPTTQSAAECVLTAAPGSGFTAAGGLSMATAGDSVTWTLPYFALGHTALANAAPTIVATNEGNHVFDFQADTGSGFGAWAELTGPNLAAVGAIDPAVGIKLRVRATVTTAANNNLLTNIRIDTVTDAVSQRIQYPLPGVLTTVVAQVPLNGAEVRVYDLNDLPAGSLGTELAGAESAGASFTFDTTPGNLVWIQVMAPGFEEYGQSFPVPTSDTTLSVILQPELND